MSFWPVKEMIELVSGRIFVNEGIRAGSLFKPFRKKFSLTPCDVFTNPQGHPYPRFKI
jgi:hypothetical protein